MPTQEPSHSFLDIYAAFRRFSWYARPDWRYILLTILLITGIAATNTAMIWLIGFPFDLLEKGEYAMIYGALALFAVIVVLNQGMHSAERFLSRWLGLHYRRRLRSGLFSHILRLSFPGTADFDRGDLIARLDDDTENTRNLVLEVPFDMVSHALILTFYSLMLFRIDRTLALLAMAATPVFILHQIFFGVRKHRAATQYLKENAEVVSMEEESLRNLQGISSFTAEAPVRQRHDSLLMKALKKAVREDVVDVAFDGSLTLLIYFTGLVVAVAGIYGISRGALTTGGLVSFLLYLAYLTVPVRGIAGLVHEARSLAASVERVAELFDTPGDVMEERDAGKLAEGGGRIELKSLSFAYPAGIEVFKGANLTINGGGTVALVGRSGSGKSTLARLLLRFYDPAQGSITIDDTDIRTVSLRSLREKIAVVWQEPFIVSDTVRANLLMARPEADEKELVEACRASNALEFIEGLENGLETKIGAGGVELSSGQRQRLAIAQAFIRNANILILDEASSALDSRNERLVAEALERLRGGRTTIIIAHRYSSIRLAGLVVYFNGDGTVTTGSHEELFESHPGYREAVRWQTEQSAYS